MGTLRWKENAQDNGNHVDGIGEVKDVGHFSKRRDCFCCLII
jgi:hypothetical protein